MADGKHTATVYLQVVPRTRRHAGTVEPKVADLVVEAMTKNPPDRPRAGSVTVRLNLTLPDAVFLPLSPTVDVEIPAEGVEVVPIVDATPMPVPVDAEEGDGRG